MPRLKNEIIAEIDEHIRRNGGEYPTWCLGIASKPDSELFRTHEVEEKNDLWMYREAFTSDAARAVRDHFVQMFGTEAEAAPEEGGGRFVYVYKGSPQPNLSSHDLQLASTYPVKRSGI